MSDTAVPPSLRTPTVYFIDDSATMREVIKIAFRKENINVVTCHDAATALAQFSETTPDVVITDVIMPDKDGYEVCQFVKEHPDLRSTPVILMSGIVNRTVAEKALAVKADELIRKPFQPQELIARVKNLLFPRDASNSAGALPAESPRPASEALSTLFASVSASPEPAPAPSRFQTAPSPALRSGPSVRSTAALPILAPKAEIQKLRNEVRRLELLVKKLQAELEAERNYCAALESQLQAHQETE